jgi:hypothetical protein
MIAIPKHIQKGIERWQKEPGKTKRSQYIHPFDRCKGGEQFLYILFIWYSFLTASIITATLHLWKK